MAIGGAVILFIFIIFISAIALKAVFTDDSMPESNNIENAKDIFEENSGNESYIIKAFKDNIVYLVDTESGKIYSALTDDDTVITGINGGKIDFSSLKIGDIVSVVKNEETGSASQIRWSEEAWKKEGKGDVRVDVGSSSVAFGEEIYKYGANTLFTYNGQEIKPEDISYADVVDVAGIKNNVYSINVVKRHGYLYFKNAETVDNIKARIDFGEEYDVSGGTLIIPGGTHTILVMGTNIDDYMTEVTVSDTQSAEIDMSLAKEKTSKLILSVKPEGSYKVKIGDKEYADGTKKVDLSKGTYVIKISRVGFDDYVGEINVENEEELLEIELKKTGSFGYINGESTNPSQTEYGNVTIYSEPGWARVYVDGVYKGVTPIMERLSYGEHYVRLSLDGYDDVSEYVNVNKAETTYRGVFE